MLCKFFIYPIRLARPSFNSLKHESPDIIFQNYILIPQEMHYTSTVKQLVKKMFGEKIAAYSENWTQHIDKLCGQN
jgi:hypothetical protein